MGQQSRDVKWRAAWVGLAVACLMMSGVHTPPAHAQVNCATNFTSDSRKVPDCQACNAVFDGSASKGDLAIRFSKCMDERAISRANEERAAAKQRSDAFEARLANERDAQRKLSDEANAAYSAQRKREQEESDRELRKADAKTRREAVERNAMEDARRASCGAEYGQVQVGMRVSRAQQCVAPFKLVGQMHRADGVLVDSYQHCRGYRCTYLTVIDGTVAAWSN